MGAACSLCSTPSELCSLPTQFRVKRKMKSEAREAKAAARKEGLIAVYKVEPCAREEP